jgi:hypothetical protein
VKKDKGGDGAPPWLHRWMKKTMISTSQIGTPSNQRPKPRSMMFSFVGAL